MNICYISLGSNLDQPLQQVNLALSAIAQLGTITAQSSWYKSKAIGPGVQDDYINGVICLHTPLLATELLLKLQDIEHQQGRIRILRWGARTLDLDILLFNNITINTPSLSIPHPRLTERNFVVFPLYEISPQLILPNNHPIKDLIDTLSNKGLEKLH
jgi:2-amino-4-hydroxy-6-hydroxymethyldihydropteridine diphosphokinase